MKLGGKIGEEYGKTGLIHSGKNGVFRIRLHVYNDFTEALGHRL